jgi:hypothetical protein
MTILLGITIWQRQGLLTVLVLALAAQSVTVTGVMIERRWLRHSGSKSTTEGT